MTDMIELAERVERAGKTDRDLDWDVAVALGGQIRKVTGLGLSGRTPGRNRVFWPWTETRNGSAIPYYTKDGCIRAKTAATLRALSHKGRE